MFSLQVIFEIQLFPHSTVMSLKYDTGQSLRSTSPVNCIMKKYIRNEKLKNGHNPLLV
jgi:hypothetical protein